MIWVVSRFRLKAPPGISSSCVSPLASLGQRSRASWASQPQKSATLSPQPGGKPRKFIRTFGGIGKKNLTGAQGLWGHPLKFYNDSCTTLPADIECMEGERRGVSLIALSSRFVDSDCGLFIVCKLILFKLISLEYCCGLGCGSV